MGYTDDMHASEDLPPGRFVDSENADELVGNMFEWVTDVTACARSAAQTYGVFGNEVRLDPSSAAACAAPLATSLCQRSSTRICVWSYVWHVGKPGSRQNLVRPPSFELRDWRYKMMFDQYC
jgi:hypothetical protein